ncbi:MAG: sigma 54-dependent Fis family transcriptional regulator [Deltaproteobacteria bacterium]|nr:sigma 54-dependent Fis family transcriptional regulator [Deltaproteobacteria bacterium]
MLTLHLYRFGERIQSLTTDKNVLKLGRGFDCDLVLHDPTISRTHCVLSKKESGWLLEDSSKNGLMYDGDKKIEERLRLETGKRYELGRLFSFEIENVKPAPLTEPTLITTLKPTQLISLDEEAGKMRIGTAEVSGQDLQGKSYKKNLESGALSIGSHESSDLRFNSSEISQFHCRIDFNGKDYILSDLNSTNGSLIDGVSILKAKLPAKTKITVGPFEIFFQIQETEIDIIPKNSNHFMGMVSQHPRMKKTFSLIEAIASTEAPAFISGETGTGKELVAKAIHTLSRRYHSSFVAINCAALPKDLVESELFGHEKGSFTGAAQTRIGAFEAANKGSLFLDEIAELDFSLQGKLLRVLETGEVKRVGATMPIFSSVRIISATHKDLKKEVLEGRFREDLYYRLHIAPISLPPLRERIDDLVVLVPHLLKQLHLDYEADTLVLDGLREHLFPGNIRELKNILQRAAIEYEVQTSSNPKTKDKILRSRHFHFLKSFSDIRDPETVNEFAERDRIEQAMKQMNFSQSKAARLLGMPLSTLNDKVHRYAIVRRIAS